jgi:hypothetical protein
MRTNGECLRFPIECDAQEGRRSHKAHTPSPHTSLHTPDITPQCLLHPAVTSTLPSSESFKNSNSRSSAPLSIFPACSPQQAAQPPPEFKIYFKINLLCRGKACTTRGRCKGTFWVRLTTVLLLLQPAEDTTPRA